MADQRAACLSVPPKVRGLAERNEHPRGLPKQMEAAAWRQLPDRADNQRQPKEVARHRRRTETRWASQLRRLERTRQRRPEWLAAIRDLQLDLDIDHPVDVANAMFLEDLITLGEIGTVTASDEQGAMELLAAGSSAGDGPRVELLRSFLLRCRHLAAAGPDHGSVSPCHGDDDRDDPGLTPASKLCNALLAFMGDPPPFPY